MEDRNVEQFYPGLVDRARPIGLKLLNLTYNDPERWQEVRRIAGDDIGFFKSICLGGTGSPKAMLLEAPPEATAFMQETVDRNHCNIEMRTQGLVLRFRCRQEVYGLVMSREELLQIETSFGAGEALYITIEHKSGCRCVLESTGFNIAAWRTYLRKHLGNVLRES